jgi:transcriptional regulator with XRE-family HTH domain
MHFKSTLYKIIGDRIKVKRKEKGYSQDDLSKFLNIGRSSISNIEIGRHQVPLFSLYELSKFLNVSIYDIIPSYDEVLNTQNSYIKEYSKFINSKDLSETEKENVEDVLNNLGKNDK